MTRAPPNQRRNRFARSQPIGAGVLGDSGAVPEGNLQTVRRGYEVLNRGEIDRFLTEFVHSEYEFHTGVQVPSIPTVEDQHCRSALPARRPCTLAWLVGRKKGGPLATPLTRGWGSKRVGALNDTDGSEDAHETCCRRFGGRCDCRHAHCGDGRLGRGRTTGASRYSTTVTPRPSTPRSAKERASRTATSRSRTSLSS
jgi:hypothetical protein